MRLAFTYDHEYRLVEDPQLWRSKAGDLLLSGPDLARGGEYRTFRVDRIAGGYVRLVQQRGYRKIGVKDLDRQRP